MQTPPVPFRNSMGLVKYTCIEKARNNGLQTLPCLEDEIIINYFHNFIEISVLQEHYLSSPLFVIIAKG